MSSPHPYKDPIKCYISILGIWMTLPIFFNDFFSKLVLVRHRYLILWQIIFCTGPRFYVALTKRYFHSIFLMEFVEIRYLKFATSYYYILLSMQMHGFLELPSCNYKMPPFYDFSKNVQNFFLIRSLTYTSRILDHCT